MGPPITCCAGGPTGRLIIQEGGLCVENLYDRAGVSQHPPSLLRSDRARRLLSSAPGGCAPTPPNGVRDAGDLAGVVHHRYDLPHRGDVDLTVCWLSTAARHPPPPLRPA